MSSEPIIAPYGTWESPISADLVSGSSVSFAEVHVNPKSGTIYLVEGRPAENGRRCIMEYRDGEWIDILPKKYSAKSKVYEYGGGSCCTSHDGSLIFSDGGTGGAFRLKSNDNVEPVVEASDKLRYADFEVHPLQHNLIVAVQEEHTGSSVENRIVLINADNRSAKIICQGADFYVAPKFNIDGTRLSWVQWNHPDMPFTGSELYVAEWKNEDVSNPKYVAGKAGVESVGQPKWHEDGNLFFSSDRTGFTQLYILTLPAFEIRPLTIEGWEDAELNQKTPMMPLGTSSYIFLSPTQIILTATKLAIDSLLLVDINTRKVVELPLGLVDIPMTSVRRISDSKLVVVGSELTSPAGLYLIDLDKASEKSLLRSTSFIPLAASEYSIAKHVTFPRTHGTEVGGVAHAILNLPHNPLYGPVPGSKPPAILSIHGGPTGHRSPGLELSTQYWTSRGYAFVLVNYVGSSGYGRKYRDLLNFSWGVKDVEDSASCVAYLAEQGLVDGSKVGITGGSAGGYTVLQALVDLPKLFAGGVSLYGISNVKLLAEDTHKYESHYLFALMFPEGTSEEEQEKIYHDRSPCFHAENIESPLLLLQGSIDKVVPLPQAQEMERVMKKNGKVVDLIVYEGEGHGFVMKKNVLSSVLETEKMWRRTLLN